MLIALLFFSPFFQLVPIQPIGMNSSAQSAQYHILGQAGQGSVSMVLEGVISAHYSLFNLNIPEDVNGTIIASSLSLINDSHVSLVTSFSPHHIHVTATLANGTTVSLPVTIQKGVYAAFIGYQFTVPAQSPNFTVSITGVQNAESFLYRQVAYIPLMTISGVPNVTTSSTTLIAIPYHAELANAYTYGGPGGPGGFPFTLNEVRTSGGYMIYSVPLGSSASGLNTIVVQSIYYYPATIAIFVLAVAVVILSIMGFVPTISKRFSALLSGLNRTIQENLIQPLFSSFGSSRRKNNVPGSVSRGGPSGARRFFRKYVQSKNLLVLFILTGVLMASFAAVTGPSPQFKAYIIADPSIANQIQTNLQAAIPNIEVITPAQDYVDFQVMSNVGTFNMIVVSNYTSFNVGDVATYVGSGISNVPVIVIDNTSNPEMAAQFRTSYTGTLVNVQNAANLNATELQNIRNAANCCAKSAPNILGLQLSNNDFNAVAAVEGGLSLILVYLGWAFIASKAVEPTNENTLTHMTVIVALGIFVFFYSEMTYVVTSTIMRLPISLHAVLSGATNLTATSLFGVYSHIPLGGGSTPRDLAATLGIFIGALGIGWESQFSKKSLVFFIAMGIVFYFNPFVLGSYTFQFLLLFVGNVYLGPITSSLYSFKGFLYGIGKALGGSVTPVYLLSAGKMAYFAGLIPLAFIKRMAKNTATLTLVVCAIILGHGGLRVGEMTPDKTIIAVMPGIFAGLVFGLILLLIAAFERYLSAHYRRGEPL
jgi:hypothetical protein